MWPVNMPDSPRIWATSATMIFDSSAPCNGRWATISRAVGDILSPFLNVDHRIRCCRLLCNACSLAQGSAIDQRTVLLDLRSAAGFAYAILVAMARVGDR